MESQRLRILILGTPSVTWDGVPVKIARQQIRLLLYYLAAQWQPVNRTTLCQVFWSEKDDASARKLLREALSKLRAALPDPSVLVTQAGDVYLDPSKVYIDGIEFKNIANPLLASAEISRDAVLPMWMYNEMRNAMSLYRGILQLEGAEGGIPAGYENFLNLASHYYDYRRMKINERLVSHSIAIGNLDEAILWLSKARELDPLNDENNFLLIKCLRECGRTKDALDYISYLESLYTQSTGQELPASIVAQKKHIIEAHENIEKEIPEWPGKEERPVPYIGRNDLLNRIQNAYYRKGIISVRGPSGIGKNRLLQEFYSSLARKPRLIFCTGKPMVRCSPFEPLIEGFRTAVKPEEWLRLSKENRQSLQVLFPEIPNNDLGDNKSDQPVDAAEDFLRICEALHQLLILMAEKKPILMIMDIIVWTDEASIEFLSYLSDRDFYRKYGLLVLVSRKEESSPAFETFVDRNLVLGMLERIDVLPLTKEESTLLIEKMLGRNPGTLFIDKFYQQTGGNPYFMVEGIKSLLSLNFNFDQYQLTSLYPIPDTIKALISETTHTLTANARKVLQAASVLGQFFMPEVVEAIEELPTVEIISALEELEKTSIVSIRENPETGTGYFFDHDQIREVILSEMSPLRKRHLHLKAVHALIKVYGNRLEYASTCAYHYEQAQEVVEAFYAWLQAAEFARTRFSASDRYVAYEKAKNLVTKLPPDQLVDNVYKLIKAWGNLAYDLSDVNTCEKIHSFCLEIGEQTQSPLLLGVAWSGLGQAYGMQLKIEEGIESIKRAQFFIDRTCFLCEKLENASRLGILFTISNNIIEAINVYEKAMALLQDIKEELEFDATINILTQLSFLYSLTGWPQKSIEVADRAVNLGLLVKRRSAKVQAVTALASAYYFAGNYNKALENAQGIYSLAGRLGMRWWISFLDVLLARIYLVIGNMDACWNHFQLAYEREIKVPEDRIFLLACSIGGQIYRLYGDLKSAKNLFLRGMDPDPQDFGTFENHLYYCLLLIAEGNPVEAQTRLKKIIEDSCGNNLMAINMPARVILGEVMLFFGQDSEGSKLQEIVQEIDARKYKISMFYGMGLLAEAKAAHGNKDAAIAIYRSMLSKDMELQNVWIRITAYSGLYKLLNSAEEKQKVKKEINKNLALIGEKSTLPPLRRLYLIYRKKTLKSLY